jgi:hypothetical protein
MKLVHSLWSQPLLDSAPVDRQTKAVTMLWCYASSVAFAKYYNQPIRLYADGHAAELLSFLPYDDVLPLKVPAGTPSSFWAAGKFSAYAQMRPGDVHIDGDVFLQTGCVMHLLEHATKHYGLLVQCIENDCNCNVDAYDAVVDLLNIHGVTYDGKKFPKFTQAYNTGLISFGDMGLRDKYVKLYFDAMEQIKAKPELVADLKKASAAPDIVLEQQTLCGLAKGYTVYSLLGAGELSYNYSRAVGYQHLLGEAKTTLLYKTIQQLYEIDPEIFALTTDAVNNLLLQDHR